MAPSEEFVERLQARFALSDFFTLVLWRPNEYDFPNWFCRISDYVFARPDEIQLLSVVLLLYGLI